MLHVEDQLPGSNHRVRGAMQRGKFVDQRDPFEAAIQEACEVDNFLISTTMDEITIAREKPLCSVETR